MQVWFYQRDAQLGDYVYADGSYSDLLNRAKTLVGICFYINPKDKNERLMMSPIRFNEIFWGLSTMYTPYGVPDVKLQDDPEYNVYDTPVPNFPNPGIGGAIDENNIRDVSSEDGFKYFNPDLNVAGCVGFVSLKEPISYKGDIFSIGSRIPYGKWFTLLLMQHRDKICNDAGVNLPLPKANKDQSLLENLQSLMADITNKEGYSCYKQFYYPASSLCYCYEPIVQQNEMLNEKFKAGNWFLPAAGDLIRICWYYNNSMFSELIHENLMEDFKTGWCISSNELAFTKYSGVSMLNQTLAHYETWQAGQDTIPVCAF